MSNRKTHMLQALPAINVWSIIKLIVCIASRMHSVTITKVLIQNFNSIAIGPSTAVYHGIGPSRNVKCRLLNHFRARWLAVHGPTVRALLP